MLFIKNIIDSIIRSPSLHNLRQIFFSLQQGMCGMKRDCGGAAGILGAFYAAVKLVCNCDFLNYRYTVTLVTSLQVS